MTGEGWFCRRTGWRFAFLLSGLIHIAGVLILSLLPCSKPIPATEPYIQIDCCGIAEDGGGGGDAFLLFPRINEVQGPSAKAETKNSVPFLPVVHQPFEPKLLLPAENPHGMENPPIPSRINGNSGNNTGNNSTITASQLPGKGMTGAKGVGGKPGQGTTSFFQIPAQGLKIVYVLDRSSSMGKQGALLIAVQELVASLQSLPEHAYFQIIVYNSSAHSLSESYPGWIQATWENKKMMAQALVQLEATRGTVHNQALPKALSLHPDTIFFLTDADDLELFYLNEITRLNKGKAAIHVIELNTSNSHRRDTPLQIFARQNQGTYQAIDLGRYPQAQ